MIWQLGPRTRIIIGRAAAPQTVRAAAYLQREVQARSGVRWEIAQGAPAAPGDVVLGTPGDGTELFPGVPLPEFLEELVLWCDGDPAAPSVYALAGSANASMAAAGKLARTLELAPGSVRLRRLSLRERPAFPIRGHTLANHKQTTAYDKWEWSHWQDYLTELAAWGCNSVILYPLHPARWTGALPFGDGALPGEPPWFDRPEREAEFRRQWEIQRRIPGLCHALGMRYGLWIPTNDIFPEEVKRHPELTKFGGPYVCPQIPEARRRIRAIRERLFAELEHLDVLFLPSRDDGGCPGCEQCNPWGPVYLELVCEQTELARRYHPQCMVWLSLQGLTAAEAGYVLDWLDRERPEWIEGVAFGPFGEIMTFDPPDAAGSDFSLEGYARSGPLAGPPARLRAALPGRYRLILYPDETHTFRCQYPIVGMDPAVQFVWQREDGPAPRPREMAAIHHVTATGGDGSIPYSEGTTDDVNKFVWSALDWNPARPAEEIVAEYARWFFGSACAEPAAAMILKLEQALSGPLYHSPLVPEARALMERCETVAPELLENWRWLVLRLGVLMLDYIQQVQRRDRQLAATLRYRAAAWHSLPDPRPGLRRTITYLERRLRETDALLDECVWTRDRLFALQRLAVRGVSRLQRSYMKWDVLLERWRDVLERIERGELASFPERRAALVTPLQEAEDSMRLACTGMRVVAPLQEFAWESGETRW